MTRAQVHAPPDEADGASNASSDRQGFISRASILSKWGTTTTTPIETTKTKKELIEQFWRQSDYISTENVRSLNGQAKNDGVYKNPAAFSSEEEEECCPSDCEECCDDDCSQCSCSSCASVGTVLNKEPQKQQAKQADPVEEQQPALNTQPQIEAKDDEEKAPEPVPLSLVKQRKMEFERLRVLEEQENRLKELVKQQKKTSTSFNSPAGQSWLDIAKRAKQLEDKWYKARRTASSVVNPAQAMYEPVPPSQVYQSNKEESKKKMKKKSSRKSRNRKRSKVLQQLRSRMRENLASDIDPGVRQKRHQELQELLSDALHAGTQTLSNINLGLIYVPMEEQLEQEKINEKADDASVRSSQGSRLTVVEQLPEEPSVQNGEDNEDVFGSIDTLIFEPKVNGSSTLKTEEIDEMEEKINHEFDYLNDSQYGSCHEDSLASERSRSSMSSRTNDSLTGSKNGRRAAAASASRAMPRHQQLRFATEGPTGSCAAAASCDASAFNSTHSSSVSLTSFESVIRRGEESMRQQSRIPTPPPLPPALLVPPAESSDDSTPRQDVKSNQMDSEAYTHVDTDASWDYYPEDGVLAVGNLRKRPSLEMDEADETARLLESLRVAEETNQSTSIRLIFPTDSRKQSMKDFMVLPEEAPSVETSGSRSPVQSPDSGFRSLQVPPVQQNGPKKRDTMIRELKSRLMDKFPCVGDDRDSSAPPSVRRPSEKKKTKKASKLESLLATFNALAEMKVDGRVYRVYQEPLINEVDYESINWGAQSTGYPHHLQNIYQRLHHADGYSEPASTIYNPSLPDEFIYNRAACFEGDPFIDCEVIDEQSVSDPLEERSSSSEPDREPVRKQRRRRKKRSPSTTAWSDVENQIFAEGLTDEEALLLQHQFANFSDLPIMNRQLHHPSRMAQYHDDWLFWDQMHNWCQSDADRERWESERARRMLLWMHHVQANCEAAGLPMPDWWQV